MPTQSDVAEMLTLLGSRVSRADSRKVVASCPFEKWLHSGGRDSHPSFAAISKTGGRWSYRCMGCGERGGSLTRLYWRVVALGGRPPTRANTIAYAPFEEPSRDVEVPVTALSYGVGGKLVARPKIKVEWRPGEAVGAEQVPIPSIRGGRERESYLPSEDEVSRETSRDLPGAFLARGFSGATCREWEIGWDPYRRRVSIPCRDRAGNLLGITRRLVWHDPHVCYRCGAETDGRRCGRCNAMLVKYLHTPGSWRSRALFGVHKVEPGAPIVVTEGPLDAIGLWQSGVRSPVALFGASPSKGQIDMLVGLARSGHAPIVCMGDGDDAGRRMNLEISEALSAMGIECEVVELPDGSDPCDLSMADRRWSEWLIGHVQSIARRGSTSLSHGGPHHVTVGPQHGH